MSKEITTKSAKWMELQTYSDAVDYATKYANSAFCPSNMKGKPEDVLISMQMGAELGLSPSQAIQNIAVINGKPSIYGDAVIGLVRASGLLEDIQESYENDIATCTIKRKGEASSKKTVFTKEDAVRAGLWDKSGPWKNYPARMMQMRARGFALRDTFADVLKGLITQEEAQDYPTPKERVVAPRPTAENVPSIGYTEELSKLKEVNLEFVELAKRLNDPELTKKYRGLYKNSKNNLDKMTDLLKQLEDEFPLMDVSGEVADPKGKINAVKENLVDTEVEVEQPKITTETKNDEPLAEEESTEELGLY